MDERICEEWTGEFAKNECEEFWRIMKTCVKDECRNYHRREKKLDELLRMKESDANRCSIIELWVA